MTNVMIVGYGEVGKAIYEIESKAKNKIRVMDKTPDIPKSEVRKNGKIEVIHICIPFSREFVTAVTYYAKEFHPRLIIIHSTTAVGITDKVREAISDVHAKYIVHSPVRGVHPNLYEGIITFVKYVGGEEDATEEAIKYFKSININAESLGSSKTTELTKIMSTSYYGWNILFAKECKILCSFYGVDFDKVYTEPNITYNKGYVKLGMKNVVRPILTPPRGKIGGHCIGANFELLPGANLTSDLKTIFRLLNEK